VLIVWPQSDLWPDDGEYDFVEVDIGDTNLEAFLHYPHPNLPVEQENPSKSNVDITQWHNYGFEWTATGLKGYIDGVEWFSYADGGGPNGRSNIQDMPSGHLTIQLDNFFGASGMQEGYMDVQWARVYGLNGGPTGGGGTGPSQADINKEKALEITSTAENSTKNWWDSYDTIEDILDGRGYTAGIVGVCSATGDMLELVQDYVLRKPTSNVLEPYVDNLQTTTNYGDTVDSAEYGVDGGGASDIAASELGSAFQTDWVDAATNDAIFRLVQRDFRDRVYWQPAYDAAVADGLGPLGLAIYYDTSVNHGPGDTNSNDGSFDDIRSRTTGTKPKNGGSEVTWLTNFLNKRAAVLTSWGDNPSDGRINMFKNLLSTGNLQLATPFSWSVYGDTFTMSTDPTPHTE
jgi:chitosanase